MNFTKVEIVVSKFKEHPVIDSRNYETNDYDIVSKEGQPYFYQNNKFNLEAYCKCLIEKLITLSREDVKPFMEYHCKKVDDPMLWLRDVEILIEQNHSIFIKYYSRHIKLIAVIETVRDKVQYFSPIDEPVFDFKKLKREIESIESIPGRLIILKRKKTEFLQYNALNNNKLSNNFIEAVDYEISYLIDLQALVGLPNEKRPKKTANQLKFNANTNVLADIFFQMMTTKGYGGKNLIEADIQQVTLFLSENFLDRDNQPLSPASLETMLRPGRSDKRPQGSRRVKILNA